MSLDFFQEACQYPNITAEIFGLCDDEDSVQAYPDFENNANWDAEVRNSNNLDIIVRAIDKCVLQDHEYKGRDRCDCMLTTDTHLYLVELKHKEKRWKEKAKKQLVSTIQFLYENHDLSRFKKKKALACNRKRPRFEVISSEENKAFLKQTGFRIDIQAKIVVF